MGNSLSLAFYLATRQKLRAGSEVEEPALQAELRGQTSTPRPSGPLMWFHTGQDHDAPAVREFARRLLVENDGLTVLTTTSAPVRRADADPLIAQLAPEETRAAVRAFLDHWRPDMAVWTEPDLRPALIAEAATKGIPLCLVDARTARPDPQAWRWWRGVGGSTMSRFGHVLAGDAANASALRKLGANTAAIEVAGYLEEGAPALPCNEAERDALAQVLDGRPVWLAAAVDRAECGAVATAHARALRGAHRLLLLLVPANPEWGPQWAADLSGMGLSVALRSNGEEPGAQTQAYVADTESEMGLWYRLAPISFLGRSLKSGGGINPFGAAALGSAILHGPSLHNHRVAYDRLAAAGAAVLVRNAPDLGDAVARLLSPDIAATMAHDAWRVCSEGAAVTDRLTELILTALDEAGHPA